MKDERTTQILQKIYTEMTLIIILLCAASLSFKVIVYEKSLNDCMLEWIILVGSPVYRLIRTRMLQVPLMTGPYNTKDTVKRSFTTLLFILGMFGLVALLRPEKITPQFIITFLIPYCFLVVVLRIIVTKSEERHAKKLGEEYDD